MPLHAEKVMVWCAISVIRVFRPILFWKVDLSAQLLEYAQRLFLAEAGQVQMAIKNIVFNKIEPHPPWLIWFKNG